MKHKLYLIIIPLITIAVSVLGSAITSGGMVWYKTLNLPSIAPPGGVIGAVWTAIFFLATISAILFWSQKNKDNNRNLIIALFLINAFLNVLWSMVFFGLSLIGWAIIEMILLNASTIALVILMWRKFLVSAVLLLPYVFWVSFATYLTISIWQLN